MRKIFVVVLVVSVCFSTLVDLSSGRRRRRWWRRRRSCSRQDCVLDVWKDSGSCSKSCGPGYKYQRKSVKVWPSCGGTPCPSTESSQRKKTVRCYSRCCRVNCLWKWSSWSPCRGCGTSRQTRSVLISRNPSCGGTACPSKRSETRSCYTGM